LAKGHAVSHGRNYLTMDDIPILIKVVLSTASIERVMIFDLLLQNGGTITTSQISAKFKISKNTALKTMAQLKVLGLVKGDLVEIEDSYSDDYNQEYESRHSNSQKSITLESNFEWFLSEEFQKLREGFIPEGKSKYDDNIQEDGVMKKYPQATKEKSSLPTLKKYDDTDKVLDYEFLDGFFWKSFEEIEEKEKKASPILGPKLIKRVKLTNELLNKTVIASSEDTPIVITGEVVDKIINKLVREGKLAEPRKGQYYKIKRDNKSAADASAAA
jgi:predicted transcriptional regulator